MNKLTTFLLFYVLFGNMAYAIDYEDFESSFFSSLSVTTDNVLIRFKTDGPIWGYALESNDESVHEIAQYSQLLEIKSNEKALLTIRNSRVDIMRFENMEQTKKDIFPDWNVNVGWLVIYGSDLRSFGQGLSITAFFVSIVEDADSRQSLNDKYSNIEGYSSSVDGNLVIVKKEI